MTTKFIPVAKPWLGDEESDAAGRAIHSGWVTQGPEVKAFEQEFATYVDAPFACAVANCTAALHLALLAVGVKPGDEVITVSHSFIATASSVKYCQADPIFVDIEPDSFNLNPELLEQAITTKTAAILVVHQMGMPASMERIMDIARQHRLPVVEDAACAVGSTIQYRGHLRKIGYPIGDVICFSFHPRKIITTGDGGMLTTANPEYDRQFRLLRQHGMGVPDAVRHGNRQVIFENYDLIGFNYRMTDIQAAVGRVQLRKLDELVGRRRKQVEIYRELLSGLPQISLPIEPDHARSNWQSFCIRLADGIDQLRVMQYLLDHGIATRRGIMCAHREVPYREKCRYPLPESERAQDHGLIIPLYHEMGEAEQRAVSDCLRAALA